MKDLLLGLRYSVSSSSALLKPPCSISYGGSKPETNQTIQLGETNTCSKIQARLNQVIYLHPGTGVAAIHRRSPLPCDRCQFSRCRFLEVSSDMLHEGDVLNAIPVALRQ